MSSSGMAGSSASRRRSRPTRPPRPGRKPNPSKCLHRKTRVPDLRHVLDLVTIELHELTAKRGEDDRVIRPPACTAETSAWKIADGDRRTAVCPFYGRVGAENIVGHGFYPTKAGKRRRYRCRPCGQTFASTKGTPYHQRVLCVRLSASSIRLMVAKRSSRYDVRLSAASCPKPRAYSG